MKLGQSIKRLRVNKARQVQSLFAQNIGITQTNRICNSRREGSSG